MIKPPRSIPLATTVLVHLAFSIAVAESPTGPRDKPDALVNSLGIRMVPLPKATFILGTGTQENPHQVSPHRVSLSAIYMAATEVTKGQFRVFVQATGIGADQPELDTSPPAAGQTSPWMKAPGDEYPMYALSWDLAKRFCAWLSEREGIAYRLPTEAEWEYAACGGKPRVRPRSWSWADNLRTHELARLFACGDPGPEWKSYPYLAPPAVHLCNPYGFWDLYGNAHEWCEDWHASGPAETKDTTDVPHDPTGPPTGSKKVLRGGSYLSAAQWCNDYFRWFETPDTPCGGIRLVVPQPDGFKPPASWTALKEPAPSQREAPAAPEVLTVQIGGTGSIGGTEPIEFIKVLPGRCVLGTPPNEPGRGQYEGPQTTVTINRPFYLGRYEVTREQWQLMSGQRPEFPRRIANGRCSVAHVRRILQKLNETERAAGRLEARAEYRLPTSWEWEYACRAGTTTTYSFGNDPEQLSNYAWFGKQDGPHAVGQKLPNPWGFHDMHGNVWEIVDGPFPLYPGGEATSDGFRRCIEEDWMECRGGGYDHGALACRSGMRLIQLDTALYPFVGLRLVRTIPEAGLERTAPGSAEDRK